MTGPRSAAAAVMMIATTSSTPNSVRSLPVLSSQPQQQQQQLQYSMRTSSSPLVESVSSSRPPLQVYTRGTTGAVKTHPRSSASNNSVVVTTTPAAATAAPSSSQQQHRHRRSRSSSSQTRQDHNEISAGSSRRRRQQQRLQRMGGDHRSVQSEASASTNRSGTTSRSSAARSKPIPTTTAAAARSNTKTDSSTSRSIIMAPELTKLHVKVARRVVEDLSRACTAPDKRIAAITNACEILDHSDEARHNIELYHGAATALSKLLLVTNKDDEIRMILSATEMIFRGSPKTVAAAFLKMNAGQQFLQHLIRLLRDLETRKMKHAEISILNISKILYSCSRSSELRALLVRVPGMLSILARVSSSSLKPASRLQRIRILANLSNCEDNKVLLYEQDNLLEAVLRIAHFDEQPVARQCAATALMELSAAPALQVRMASSDNVLGTLVKLILVEKSSTTRENAISALQNLAFVKENRLPLILFKNGIVLETLKKVLTGDYDTQARRRSAGALTNLACDETAAAMGRFAGLLETLAVTATRDENPNVQTRASLALTKIASSITVHMECHPAVLDALVVASLSLAPNNVSGVLRVKARSPENRPTLARHSGVMDTLCDIVMSEGANVSDRDNAVRAVMHLVNDDGNHTLLCNKTVLTALVTAANFKDPDLTEARDSAIRALERLATEVSNRVVMAHHEGLLVAVAKAVEREAKWEQAGHYRLANESSEYLAKPLLMSLLVAM